MRGTEGLAAFGCESLRICCSYSDPHTDLTGLADRTRLGGLIGLGDLTGMAGLTGLGDLTGLTDPSAPPTRHLPASDGLDLITSHLPLGWHR